MWLPEEILAILACPICKHRLGVSNTEFLCSSQACEARFPIIEGRPILLNERNSVFRIKDYVHIKSREAQEESTLKRFFKRLAPSVTQNWAAGRNYTKLSNLLHQRGPHSTVLIVGGGDLGEGLEHLVGDKSVILVETDVRLTTRTNLIADGHDLPFLDESFDAVVIQAVLEHVLDPYRCVAEIHRVLKPEGAVYAESPFMYPVHMGCYDFTRFSLSAHRRLFRNFSEIDSGVSGGPGQALALSVASFVRSFSTSFAVQGFASVGLPFLTFWLKYCDYFLVAKPHSADFASAVFFLGTKSCRPIPDEDIISGHWTKRNDNPVDLQERPD